MTDGLRNCRTALEFVKKDSDNKIIETQEWLQVITPGAPTPFMNSVLRSLLTEVDADSHIRSAIKVYSAYKLPFRWVVSPWSSPPSLPERLRRHGFKLHDVTAGLSASASALATLHADGVKIEQLTQENAEDWIKANIAAWEIPEKEHVLVRKRVKKALAASDLFYFFARFKGKPIAVGNLRLFNGFNFLTSGAVQKQFRGLGIYKALVGHRARFSLESGIDSIVSHAATNTSAPILEGLGFKRHCELEHFFYGQK